jgi:hypothetical protein
MGNFPFVLGLSKKKRVNAISEVIKKRQREVNLQLSIKSRPHTSKPRKTQKGRRIKLRSISTSQLINRPGTTNNGTRTRMSRTQPGSPCGSMLGSTNDVIMKKRSHSFSQNDFGLIDVELPSSDVQKNHGKERFISPLLSEEQKQIVSDENIDEELQKEEVQEAQFIINNHNLLFDLIDTNNDGLISKDELVVAVTENIEVQSILEHQSSILLLPDTSIWMDVFDNIITNNVNGELDKNEFDLFLQQLNALDSPAAKEGESEVH